MDQLQSVLQFLCEKSYKGNYSFLSLYKMYQTYKKSLIILINND